MANFFSVVLLEDNVRLSCNDVQKPRTLRYYMLLTLSAVVKIFHALHTLLVTLFPFALLWWNVVLYALCSKYYSWDRSRHWLQTAGRHFCSHIIRESCEASLAEKRERRHSSPPQRASRVDVSYVAENREISILHSRRSGACGEAEDGRKGGIGVTSDSERKRQYGFCSVADAFPHQNGSCILDRYSDVIAACLEGSHSPHAVQCGERIPCEGTSLSSKSQAISASMHTSALSYLIFLARGPQAPVRVNGCHWASCSCLSPQQVPPLVMLDVNLSPKFPSQIACLQVNLHGNCNMLHFKCTLPVLFDHGSIYWFMLRKWSQICNGRSVPALICGMKHSKDLTSRTRNDDDGMLQLTLSTTDSFKFLNSISCYGAGENSTFWLAELQSLWDLPGLKMKNQVTNVDNGDIGLDSSEAVASLCCNPMKFDDECDGMHRTSAESNIDRAEGIKESGAIYGKHVYGNNDCCSHKLYENNNFCSHNCFHDREESGIDNTSIRFGDECDGMLCTIAESNIDRDEGIKDSGAICGNQLYGNNDCCSLSCFRDHIGSGIDSVEDVEDIYGRCFHPAMGKVDRFCDCSAGSNVGYNDLQCAMDADGICTLDYNADVSYCNYFDSNVESSGTVLGDIRFANDDGAFENPFEIRQVHVAKVNTGWDEDAVVVDKQESGDDSIEEGWQVV